jgi:hypothetical protein
VQRIIISITFFLFFLSSSGDAVEQLSASFESGKQTSFWTVDNDFSSENARGSRFLKRLQRGKSSVKSLPSVDKPARETFLVAWVREISLVPHSPKSSVYQQINVYRI